MPLYEFRCRACEARFERIVPMSAASEQSCACGSAADKQISNVAFLGRAPSVVREVPEVPLRRRLASSLQGVGGTREGVARAQRAEEKLARFESRNPEFADNKMPVVSHEGGRVVHATEKKVASEATRTQSAAVSG